VKKLKKITKSIKVAIYCYGMLALSNSVNAGSDLLLNTVDIKINDSQTYVDTPMNGEGGALLGFGKTAVGITLDMGSSTVVNGAEISCATLSSDCGTLNSFQIDVVNSETVVTGTDAVVNGARFTAGNALFPQN